jgi:hypothetical protein
VRALKLIQVTFKIRNTREEYEILAIEKAEQIATFPGLVWKIWAYDDEKNEAMGMYYFRDDNLAKMVLDGLDPRTWPEGTYDLKFRMWDLQEEICKITRAPL